ncbi:MAG TPA: protein translocase SEC61 complex subunit gamma [Candidatus Hodarchaeales archaeon]|nr:protein translocase SEC61 complex subunit gamma [Candidatus Hodarchaeales archaeon]
MGFFSDSMRLLKIAKKPSRKEVWIVIRVTVVGMGLLGVLGFLIKIVGEVVVKGLTKPGT